MFYKASATLAVFPQKEQEPPGILALAPGTGRAGGALCPAGVPVAALASVVITTEV